MIRHYRYFTCIALSTAALCAPVSAQVFEGSAAAWAAALGTLPISTITFDTIPGSTATPIVGNEFSALPASPTFTSVVGDGVYVGNPAFSQIPSPPSSPNMLSPSSCAVSCKGIVRLTFANPVRAVGATFVDVENEFALTGYSLVPGAAAPDIAFSSSPGDQSFSFLGFVSGSPFTAVDIYFTTGLSIDGSLLDDLVYAPVGGPVPAPIPEPAITALMALGLGALGLRGWRRKSA